jgi:predicted phage baseplate assembly protein
MALISPILDDRSYEQLKEELLRRIPVYTDEWTDFNESDPGIALLELFAYLGESVLYRLNQIPETTKLAFLRLLGVQPRPALPASVLLAATTELAEGVPIDKGVEVRAGSVAFETIAATQVWPLEAVAAGKMPAPELPAAGPVRDPKLEAERDRRADARAWAKLPSTAVARFYDTVQVPEDPTAAGAQPLDVSATLDHSLWIAVLRQDGTDLRLLSSRSLFVGIAFDEQIDVPFALQPLAGTGGTEQFGADALVADPPAMIWQLWQGPGAGFAVLGVGDDSTRGLTTTGVVEVLLPPRLPRFDPTVRTPGDEANPPPLLDEEQGAHVVAWLRVSRPSTAHINDAIHRVRWVGLNATRAEQARTARPELLGTGTGDTDQRFALTQHPVLPRTTALQVEEPDGWHEWQEVDAFVASGRDDRHYTVDHAAGAIEFGALRVPQLGERIRVLSYRYGGGLGGNVAARAVNALGAGRDGVRVSGVEIVNPLPAAGGMDAAATDEALDAIPAEVHRRDRAVVADDFRELALRVPGVRRAETLPRFHPDTPGAVAAGVVSLIVFPTEDLRAPAAPMPDLGLLRRVARYLDARRLVTTELYVIPPTYRRVVVSVGIAVRTGYQVDAVRRWVLQIVRQYLAPVPPFGPEGAGWPLGRPVRRAEIESVVVQVDGVEFVTGVRIAVPASGGYTEVVDPVDLEEWEVPQLVDLAVVSGAPLAPGIPYAPDVPDGVPVPLPPDVC